MAERSVLPEKLNTTLFSQGDAALTQVGKAYDDALDTNIQTRLFMLYAVNHQYAAAIANARYLVRLKTGEEFTPSDALPLNLLPRRTREGYKAFYVTPFLQDKRFRTAAFYLMPAMYLAGMGQMGMNCSIITPEFGPRVWVTAIITDKELPAAGPVGPVYREECEECLKCVRACPSGALDGSRWKNVFRCASYGCCGTCLSVCPQGKGN